MVILPRGAWSLYWTYVGLVFVHALGAYSIRGVPFQWMALLGFITLSLWIVTRGPTPVFPGMPLFLVFAGWAALVSTVNIIGHDVSYLVPAKATTGYLGYIGLRFMNLLSFMSVAYLTYYFCKWFPVKKQIEVIVTIGLIVTAYTYYVYIAQVYGLPEIPRTRLGTGGDQQLTTFSYAFHRAMGPFREPSHLAEWMVLPFFLSFISERKSVAKSIAMGGAILLSGSLTGIMSIVIGLGLALVSNVTRIVAVLPRFSRLFAPLIAGAVIFSVLVSAGKGYSGLFDTLWKRVEPMLSDSGLEESNRKYVFEYVDDNPFDLVGEGLGNANIIFAEGLGIDLTASFLSLYINTLYSLGYIGLALLLMLMLFPLGWHLFRNMGRTESDFVFVWAAYFAWLVIYFVHTEELSVHFGIIYAFLMYAVTKYENKEKVLEA